MDIGQIKDNKLKMILQFSLPSIIAMLLQTVITITDGYFTGNYVGEKALAAIYHFKGFPQFLFMVYQEVFCRWLSKTRNQLDEKPVLDIYRMVREDGYMEIDICFPLK